MMPPSTKVAPVSSTTRAMRSTVPGLSALQSTKIGFFGAARSVGASRSARPSASPGGRIDRMMSLAAACSSDTPTMPAALARATVASLRPSSRVRTSMPFSTRRWPTALPIMPGAITATIGCMARSPIGYGLAAVFCRPRRSARKAGSKEGFTRRTPRRHGEPRREFMRYARSAINSFSVDLRAFSVFSV